MNAGWQWLVLIMIQIQLSGAVGSCQKLSDGDRRRRYAGRLLNFTKAGSVSSFNSSHINGHLLPSAWLKDKK